jgi:ATP-binding cassette subfamily C protein LapB
MKDPLLESLIYISRYYGQSNSPDAIIADLPLANGLLTQYLFPRAANKAGLQAKLTDLPLMSISPLLFPMVALMKEDNTCVLLSLDAENEEIEVVYPHSNGHSEWVPIKELNQHYSGHVFLMKKRFQYDERSPEILKTRDGHWFWSTLWESRSIYRDVCIASILINLFVIAAPLFSRIVYDKILPNQAFYSLWVLAIGVMIIYVFDMILRLLRSYFIDIAGKKSDILLSAKIFNKVMGVRMEARPHSVGAFARHLQEFESIREFFTSATVSSLIDLPFSLLFLVIIGILSGPLALVPLFAVIVLAIYSFLIQAPLRKTIEEGSRLSSQKHANLIESLTGLETVKMFGAQNQFQYRWEEAVAHMSNWSIRSKRLTDSVQNTAGFLQHFVSTGMIVFGVYLIAEGHLSMGSLIASTMLSSRAIGPMVQLAMLSTRYNQAKSAMTIIEQLMEMPMEQEEGKRYIHRPLINGRIEFNNVSFNYPNAQTTALKNVSFVINPGEKVGIIGRIGSGKTTLERLIMGLYRPTEGSVSLDNIDLNQMHHLDVRRNIGCVSQDIMLFYGSIRENIILGRPLSTDQEIIAAAERAGVINFTQYDPAGLEKQVGEAGRDLSGGQRQAIGIARALVGKPPVLVMDEPTSSMDNRSELFIKQQLKRLSPEETLILITHKTPMLDVVDRLIVMEQGRIVMDGPKAVVMQQLREGPKSAPTPSA